MKTKHLILFDFIFVPFPPSSACLQLRPSPHRRVATPSWLLLAMELITRSLVKTATGPAPKHTRCGVRQCAYVFSPIFAFFLLFTHILLVYRLCDFHEQKMLTGACCNASTSKFPRCVHRINLIPKNTACVYFCVCMCISGLHLQACRPACVCDGGYVYVCSSVCARACLCAALVCARPCAVGCVVKRVCAFLCSQVCLHPVSLLWFETSLKIAQHGCNTLQLTATHCNLLQQTATHCNVVHHTAPHCTTLQHSATQWNSLQHTHRSQRPTQQ